MLKRRHALLVAATRFVDERLRPLATPVSDVAQLAGALADEQRCGYEVSTCVDLPAAEMRRSINRFFRNREPDDFLLLYISTHGLKDESGNLYFAAPDTSLDEPESSTVESHLIHALSRSCRARQQWVVLDACFSGAFGRPWSAKDGATLRKEDVFGHDLETGSHGTDRGLVVFTASTSFQYAFERLDREQEAGAPSLFTRHLIEGLRSGAADLNGDGVITEEELYRYALSRIRHEQPRQTPQRWVIGAVGDFVVGRSMVARAVPLPDDLLHAVCSPITHVRLGAVAALAEFVAGPHRGLAVSAAKALKELAEGDDSRKVQEAAHRVMVDRAAATSVAQAPGGEAVPSLALPSAEPPTPSPPLAAGVRTPDPASMATTEAPVSEAAPLPLTLPPAERPTPSPPPAARSRTPAPNALMAGEVQSSEAARLSRPHPSNDWPAPSPPPASATAPGPASQVTTARRWYPLAGLAALSLVVLGANWAWHSHREAAVSEAQKAVFAATAVRANGSSAPVSAPAGGPAQAPALVPSHALSSPSKVASVNATALASAHPGAGEAVTKIAGLDATAPIPPPRTITSHVTPTPGVSAGASSPAAPPSASRRRSIIEARPRYLYYVQANSTNDHKIAEESRDVLALVGIPVTVSSVEQQGRTIFPVRAGPYRTLKEAEEMQLRMRNVGVTDPSVVRVEQPLKAGGSPSPVAD